MKRRTFIQQIGSILAVLGMTEAEWLTLGDRYYQALAQPNPRKLALLIGINKYKELPLSGCLTDVELQKELLIHRFGFQASDILTLTEEQASREFIEAAFLEHLGKQAKSTDIVVFHFSGYGIRLKVEAEMQNALVPANDNQNENIVDYLLEETLLLLLRSLPTDHVTAVLDTSYYTPITLPSTGLGIRARPELDEIQLAAAELDFLQQLKKDSRSSPIVLYATSSPKQLAREVLFSGSSAGLFTYALTQYLWETTPATTIQVSLSHVGSSMQKLGSKQYPGLLSSKNQQVETLHVASLFSDSSVGCEGVVVAIEQEGRTAYLWLAGLPPKVLEYYGVNSRFTSLTGEQLVLRSRTGLTAKAQISTIEGASTLQVGQLFQEAIRVLPRNINLIVALDTKLERIERVDATSAFAGVTHVSSVVAGEQPADYVFGKLLQNPSRYGLFTLGGELIPNTAGEVGEAVKVAVNRLVPKLPTLLAAKLWRLTENEGSSRLQVKVTLEIVNSILSRAIAQRETVRSNTDSTKKSLSTPSLSNPIVPIGSRMQYRVQNNGARPVYLMLLGLKNNRTAIAFYPWQPPQDPNDSDKPLLKQVVIAPGETLTLPQSITASEWMISDPAYDYEHQLIFSTTPFSETFKALETAKYPTGEQQPIGPLVNPLEIAQALLQDLHNASAVEAEMKGIAVESYVLDVNNWASLSLAFK